MMPVATIVPKVKSSISLESSRSRSTSPIRHLQLPKIGDHKGSNRDCFVPGNNSLPVMNNCKKHDVSSCVGVGSGVGDVNLMFLQHERQRVSHEYDAGDEEEEDGLYLRDPGGNNLFGGGGAQPEMKDCECQTRESLFHNNSDDSYNQIPTPPPPLPPLTQRVYQSSKHSQSGSPITKRTIPDNFHTLPIKSVTPIQKNQHQQGSGVNGHNFTTFGYSTNPRSCGNTTSSSSNSQCKDAHLPKFKAEAVIEMDKFSHTEEESSSGGTVTDSRPFSIQSSKSAPDVIVTH